VTDNPLYSFPIEDGKRVYINYVEQEGASICMTGKLVNITCIQHADPIPSCIESKIEEIKKADPRNPPASVFRHTYNGKKVYFIPQYCCDFFSELYDANCNLICYPDGGIAGNGDGKCTDFFNTRKDEEVIWKDERGDGLGE
jgi:hypothetical protein